MSSVCVLITYGKDNVDKATIGLTLANAALEGGEQVSLILASEGVRLAVKGYADDINNGEPFKPAKQLIDGLLTGGATLNVCTPCLKNRGIAERDIIDRAAFIAGPDVIRILKETDRSIQL